MQLIGRFRHLSSAYNRIFSIIHTQYIYSKNIYILAYFLDALSTACVHSSIKIPFYLAFICRWTPIRQPATHLPNHPYADNHLLKLKSKKSRAVQSTGQLVSKHSRHFILKSAFWPFDRIVLLMFECPHFGVLSLSSFSCFPCFHRLLKQTMVCLFVYLYGCNFPLSLFAAKQHCFTQT